jgi:hypothetical protein
LVLVLPLHKTLLFCPFSAFDSDGNINTPTAYKTTKNGKNIKAQSINQSINQSKDGILYKNQSQKNRFVYYTKKPSFQIWYIIQ